MRSPRPCCFCPPGYCGVAGSRPILVRNVVVSLGANTLYPAVFPAVRKFEAEIIAMVVEFVGGGAASDPRCFYMPVQWSVGKGVEPPRSCSHTGPPVTKSVCAASPSRPPARARAPPLSPRRPRSACSRRAVPSRSCSRCSRIARHVRAGSAARALWRRGGADAIFSRRLYEKNEGRLTRRFHRAPGETLVAHISLVAHAARRRVRIHFSLSQKNTDDALGEFNTHRLVARRRGEPYMHSFSGGRNRARRAARAA